MKQPHCQYDTQKSLKKLGVGAFNIWASLLHNS